MKSIILIFFRIAIIYGIIRLSFSVSESEILIFFEDRYAILILWFIWFFLKWKSSRIWIISIFLLSVVWFTFNKYITNIPYFTPILKWENIEVIKNGFCYKDSVCFSSRIEAYCLYDFYHSKVENPSDFQNLSLDPNCVFTWSSIKIDNEMIKINVGDKLSVTKVFTRFEDFSEHTDLMLSNWLNYSYNSEYFSLNRPVFNSFIRYVNPYRELYR